jgi:hypothetical protein
LAAGSQVLWVLTTSHVPVPSNDLQTSTVAYDAIVDGVVRKASSYVAKSVNHQTNKKLDTENFLYKTDKGIIDTEIVVTLLQNVTTEQGDAPSTIGTLEMRSTSPDNSMFST